jgi:hypothetical protein
MAFKAAGWPLSAVSSSNPKRHLNWLILEKRCLGGPHGTQVTCQYFANKVYIILQNHNMSYLINFQSFLGNIFDCAPEGYSERGTLTYAYVWYNCIHWALNEMYTVQYMCYSLLGEAQGYIQKTTTWFVYVVSIYGAICLQTIFLKQDFMCFLASVPHNVRFPKDKNVQYVE